MSATKIRLAFERGGELLADVLREATPKTVDAVLAALPLEVTVYHSRWSGREVNFPIALGSKAPPRENETSTVNTGDVIYWREWEKGSDAHEAIAVYYGAEVTRDHRGHLPVNVFARVSQDQWPAIAEIGIRIWQRGTETLRISRVGEQHKDER